MRAYKKYYPATTAILPRHEIDYRPSEERGPLFLSLKGTLKQEF